MLITFLLYFKVRRVTAESADRQPIIHYRTTAHNRDGESTTPKRLYNATDDITTILNVDSVRDINSSYPRPTASRQDNMTGNIGILARPARARTDGESTTPKRLYNATDDVTTIHFVDSDRDINRSYPRPTASSWEDNTAGRVPAQPESSRRIGNDVTTTRIVDSDRDINRSYPRPTASSWEDNTGSRRVPAQPESSRRNGNDVTTVDTDRDINRPTTSTREDNMTSSMRISARPSSSRRIGSDVTATSWRDAASRWFSRRRVEDDGSQRDRRPQRPRSSNKQTVGFSSRESSPNHPTAKLLRPKSGAK